MGSTPLAREGGPPVNDFCAGAIEVPCDGTPVRTDNTGSTNSPDDPTFDCDTIPTFGNGTIWYRFTATHTAVSITSTGVSVSDGGLISLLDGACGAFTSLRCSPSIPGFDTRLVASGLVPGQEYYIEIASALTVLLPGQRQLVVQCLDVMPPANDDCFAAQLVELDAQIVVNTFGASSDSPSCSGDSLNKDVWYTALGTGQTMQAFCFSPEMENYQVNVYFGTCAGLSCVASSSAVFGGSIAEWCSIENETYYIAFGSRDIVDEGLGGLFVRSNGINCDPDPPGPTCSLTGFETRDDGTTPLVNGQELGSTLDGLVLVSSSGANAGPVVYSSNSSGPNGGSADADLLVNTGHLLILQNDNNPTVLQQTVPGIYDFPNDDPDGGTLRFDFPADATPQSIQLVDIDNDGATNRVVMTDESGLTRTYTIPDEWTGDRSESEPGMGSLDLTTTLPQTGFQSSATASQDPAFNSSRVRTIEVHLTGSGAVDDLSWCSSNTPLAITEGSSTIQNGTGLNPAVLDSWSRPLIGGTWVAGLDCSAHSAGLGALLVYRNLRPATPTPFGELLVGGPALFSAGRPHASQPLYFTSRVPPSLELLGHTAAAQGLCTGTPGIQLTNALALQLGF